MILVTGGAGFIGANFVLEWFAQSDEAVVNLDKLTYAGNMQNLASLKDDPRHVVVRGDICDRALVDELFGRHKPRAVVHFAAESHVDRSIHGPADFMHTNIEGTFCLLEASRGYWTVLPASAQASFRFLHVSTDEVYGSLEAGGSPFVETSAYAPNSPYSASKAASDHLVRAYHRTYGLPTLTTNCSNNYGPYQFPEKLIPLVIANALSGKPIPVYGDGMHIRDWLYVADHCDALRAVLANGTPGEKYNIGGNSEKRNIELVKTICAILDELRPSLRILPSSSLLTYVRDRAGHDRRYAIDNGKIAREIGWRPATALVAGLRKTVQWYLEHQAWVANVQSGAYLDWIRKNYGG